MFVISSSFIGDFKIGDNINYNLRILSKLYSDRSASSPNEQGLYNKPITILIITITEAVLYDFYRRCRTFTWEGVVNIPSDFFEFVRSKKINKFRLYIDNAEKHDLFIDPTRDLYTSLVDLSKLRNRIHIQNEFGDLEPNDFLAFSNHRLILAETCLERVLKVLSSRYPRAEHVSGFVNDFELPWNEHFHVQS